MEEGQSYLDYAKRQLELRSRPPHVRAPRARIELPFAVLLMRSSYQVADELDYAPMDEFQRLFFLFRQREWLDYKNAHPGSLIQGDLANPEYFDFISFAQYATIADCMSAGQQIFVEKVGASGERQTVQRSPALADNAQLPAEHAARVGDRILAFLQETYGENAPLVLERPGMAALAENVEKILSLFRLNFFMSSATVIADDATRTLVVSRAT
ncbi:unnamed protein product, partial [Phaeothamnion confervicola]